MPTHDFNIANQTFPNFRTDLNNALVALASNSKGSTAPSTLVEGMFWLEDDNPSATTWTLRMYGGGLWHVIGTLDTVTGSFILSNGSAIGASIYNAADDDAVRALISAVDKTGDTFTGLVGFGDNSHYLQLGGGTAVYAWDATDYMAFARASNTLRFLIGGVERLSLTAAGAVFATAPTIAGGALVGGISDRQTFNSSGTWTKPPGTPATAVVLLEGWGAGGSGGRHTSSTAGGGGGGGYSSRLLQASALGATETITIGAGGASRTGSNQNGAAGGNTTIGSLLTAYGGGGGSQSVNAGSGGTVFAAGTVGGTQTASDYTGGAGGLGDTGPGDHTVGGNSVLGGGGGGGGVSPSRAGGSSLAGGAGGASGGTGSSGSQPGGGGGAGSTTSGAGGAGRVIITIFG